MMVPRSFLREPASRRSIANHERRFRRHHNRCHRIALYFALLPIHPSQTPINSTTTISPRTLKRRNLRQGREARPAGMMATLWDWR